MRGGGRGLLKVAEKQCKKTVGEVSHIERPSVCNVTQ